jgi:hypothetical protein
MIMLQDGATCFAFQRRQAGALDDQTAAEGAAEMALSA